MDNEKQAAWEVYRATIDGPAVILTASELDGRRHTRRFDARECAALHLRNLVTHDRRAEDERRWGEARRKLVAGKF